MLRKNLKRPCFGRQLVPQGKQRKTGEDVVTRDAEENLWKKELTVSDDSAPKQKAFKRELME